MKLKLIVTLAVLLTLSTTAFGRRQETLIHGHIDHGYFGGAVSKFTTVNGDFELLLGGRGGWILDRTFSIGLAGYWLASRVRDYNELNGRLTRVDFGYGGIELSYIYNSNRLKHYEFSALIGGGAIHYFGTHGGNNEPRDDGFFVFEPAAAAVLNITHFCRASFGVSYRWVSAVDHEEILSNSELSGPAASLMLNFGSF